jgi:hypothetical protein
MEFDQFQFRVRHRSVVTILVGCQPDFRHKRESDVVRVGAIGDYEFGTLSGRYTGDAL